MKEYFLEDLLQIKNGRDHKHLHDGNIPVFGSGGIMRYGNQAIYDDESILLPRKGTLSNIQFVNKPFWTVDTIYYTIINKEKANPLYLYYYLKQLDLSYLNSGTGVPSMTFGAYYGIKVRLPKLIIQKKITKVLSDLDAKIKLNNKINFELQAMAKMLYNYWFLQFEFPDINGKPYKSSGGKMVWNVQLKREIPEEWDVQLLFNGMNVQYGFPFDTSQFTPDPTQKPIIRIRDILQNSISTYSIEDVDEKYRLQKNDLLIGMDGNFHLNFWDKSGCYLNQRSVRIRSKDNSEVSNFQALFELQPYIKAREENVSRTTVGHLSDKDLKRLYVTNSRKTANFQARKTFDNLLEKVISNRLQNHELTSFRDWLLPMLMNGQIKIK